MVRERYAEGTCTILPPRRTAPPASRFSTIVVAVPWEVRPVD